ncbi:fungal-specific transcription factor domain-containing protein [Melampsora americana]|nr:fungal-specific transcription factor domain-containing protein [Melampsora americana]
MSNYSSQNFLNQHHYTSQQQQQQQQQQQHQQQQQQQHQQHHLSNYPYQSTSNLPTLSQPSSLSTAVPHYALTDANPLRPWPAIPSTSTQPTFSSNHIHQPDDSSDGGGQFSEDGDSVGPLLPSGAQNLNNLNPPSNFFTPIFTLPKKKKDAKEVKRRSSKACDNCRKSKCKCTRAADQNGVIPTSGPCQNCLTTGAECTFNGASRKRGPPKGYIEAIESRLHRMEALLGGLLQNNDPRAQALLSELIGDNEVRNLLKKDLQAAAEQGFNGKIRKSWKLPEFPAISPNTDSSRTDLNLTDPQKLLWGVSQFDQSGRPSSRSAQSRPKTPAGAHASGDNPSPDSGLDSDVDDRASPGPSHLNKNEAGQPRRLRRRLDSNADTNPSKHSLGIIRAEDNRLGSSADSSRAPLGLSLKDLADVAGQISADENADLRYHGKSSGLHLLSKSQRYKDFFWYFPQPGLWPVASNRTPKTELDILNLIDPLEALPSREMMNHLLDLYWSFVHPIIPVLHKSEFMSQFEEVFNTLETRERANPGLNRNLNWITSLQEVHNSTCTADLDKSSHTNSRSSGPTQISILLLLVIFSTAARYSDLACGPPGEEEYWTSGDHYLEKAKKILDYQYACSKLTNCQALILLAYREIGIGAMSDSWLYTGVAIRMAQDMGLFREIAKWYVPANQFTSEEKQTRKRVWWACVILDKYVSTYIGRPMMIFERDYDTEFASQDEADEHEPWAGLRPNGSKIILNKEPKISDSQAQTTEENLADGDQISGHQDGPIRTDIEDHTRMTCSSSINLEQSNADTQTNKSGTIPGEVKSHAISCFNRSASLSVLISRIIANIYAVRTRVTGQSSETLLALLDQNLAHWYLDLPEHLHYNPIHKSNLQTPTPHLLTLHAQFYTALILLHRPFISKGDENGDEEGSYPSHSICTTAANAISNIARIYDQLYGLRQVPAFMVYYVFTASIIHVHNSTFERGPKVTSKRNFLRCMNSLKGMASTWSGAVRAYELLFGMVDLQDVVEEEEEEESLKREERGLKRSASSSELKEGVSDPSVGVQQPQSMRMIRSSSRVVSGHIPPPLSLQSGSGVASSSGMVQLTPSSGQFPQPGAVMGTAPSASNESAAVNSSNKSNVAQPPPPTSDMTNFHHQLSLRGAWDGNFDRTNSHQGNPPQSQGLMGLDHQNSSSSTSYDIFGLVGSTSGTESMSNKEGLNDLLSSYFGTNPATKNPESGEDGAGLYSGDNSTYGNGPTGSETFFGLPSIGNDELRAGTETASAEWEQYLGHPPTRM